MSRVQLAAAAQTCIGVIHRRIDCHPYSFFCTFIMQRQINQLFSPVSADIYQQQQIDHQHRTDAENRLARAQQQQREVKRKIARQEKQHNKRSRGRPRKTPIDDNATSTSSEVDNQHGTIVVTSGGTFINATKVVVYTNPNTTRIPADNPTITSIRHR